MAEDTFLTISGTSEGSYKEKGSKFLAFAYPVESEDQVKERLNHLKKEFYDARHICSAFIIGPKKDFFRAQDAGEPPHTAGDPILNEIRSKEITNCLVVVVRYFGGTKLGKSGLINAYRESAKNALENAEIVEKTMSENLSLTYSYNDTSEVMNLITTLQADIISQNYEAVCKATIAVRITKLEEARAKLEKFLD